MAHPPPVARVLQRVTATVREHEMLIPGQTVLVAVSGGPDSVCLIESLHRLRRLLKVRLEVFHLDHRLRSDSAADARYVTRLARRLRLPFHLRTVDAAPAQGDSTEAWATLQRSIQAMRVRHEVGAERLAEGHTLDDQAETLLIAAMRGGGLEALGGIWPVLGHEVQPLLGVTREEVEGFCRALHLRPRRDPTNQDTRLLRNAVRLKLLPAMERQAGRDLRRTLARTTDLLRRDEHELGHQAFVAGRDLVEETPDGALIDAAGLLAHPAAISSRVVRSTFYLLDVVPTAEAIDAVLDLAAGRPGRRRDLVDGSKAERAPGHVRLLRPTRTPLARRDA